MSSETMSPITEIMTPSAPINPVARTTDAVHQRSDDRPAGTRPYYEDEGEDDQAEFSIEQIPSPWTLQATVDWCIPGLLVENGITLISGESGIGKSMLVLALCLSIARGEPFAGRETRKRPVLYLDRENPGGVIRNRLELLGGPETEDLKYWGNWVDSSYWTNDPGSGLIEEYVVKHRPLIVVDSLIAFNPGNEQDASETRKHMQEYRCLTTLGATVILIHHSGKGESSKQYRGSSDIKAAVDVAFVVERNASEDASATELRGLCLRPFKCRMAELEPIFLEFDGHGFVPGMDPEQALEARLRDLVRQNPGKNQGELITLGILWNLPKNQILDYLADAAASGKLQTKRGPNNSIRYWVPE